MEETKEETWKREEKQKVTELNNKHKTKYYEADFKGELPTGRL